MNTILISDPFLFPPSGEDPTRHFGYTNGETQLPHWTRTSTTLPADKAEGVLGLDTENFYDYSRHQFELAWNSDSEEETKENKFYLFDHPYALPSPTESAVKSSYLPDTPESMNMEEYSLNLESYGLNDDFSELSPVTFDDQVPTHDLDGSPGLLNGLNESSQPLVDTGSTSWLNDETYASNLNWEEEVLKAALDSDEDKLLNMIQKPTIIAKKNLPFEADGNDVSLYGPPALLNSCQQGSVVNGQLIGNDPPMPSIFAPTTGAIATEVKPKKQRKALHQPMQFSPPTYEEHYEVPAVKIEPTETSPSYMHETNRRRKHSEDTDSDVKMELSPNSKKPKLYEIDSPRAKNAKAAKANREKKKNELNSMKRECELLRKKLESSEQKNTQLTIGLKEKETQLAIQTQISNSLSGLARVSESAKSVLQSMLEAFKRDFNECYKVEVPDWFRQAPANPAALVGTENFLKAGDTSSFITFHVSKQSKTILVDYSPDQPIVSHTIPALKQ